MRKPVIAAMAAIALLALGSVVVIVVATSGSSVLAPAPTAPGPAPVLANGGFVATAPAGSINPATIPGGMATLSFPPPAVVVDPAPPPPPKGSWEAVPPAARAAALGRAGPAIGRELLELRPRLDACFDEDTQARFGPRAHTVVQDVAPIESEQTTILMLQIEEMNGRVRIVDAPVESQGTASDGLIACVQQVLRGREVEIPAARAGARHRLLYMLTQ
jgi:hypothetical protein